MGDALLKTEGPSQFWRSNGGLPYKWAGASTAACDLEENISGLQFSWRGAGLVRHNVRKSSGRYRVISSESTAALIAPFSFLAPNGSSGASNITGNHTNVDESYLSPDASYISPTDDSLPASITLSFSTPLAPPRWSDLDTIPYQAIWVRAKVKGTTDMSVLNGPILTMAVVNGIDGVISVAQKVVTSSAGQWFYVEFGDGVTAGDTGANIDLFLDLSPNNISGAAVQVDTVVWTCESAQITGNALITHDSGWLSLGTYPSNPMGEQGFVESYEQTNSLLYDAGETITDSRTVAFFFREDFVMNTPLPELMMTTPSDVPPAYIEAGKIVVGMVAIPDRPPGTEPALAGLSDLSTQNRTRGGQEFGSSGPRLRTATVTLPALSIAWSSFFYERWVRTRGVLGPVLVSINPSSELERELFTMYCTLESVDISMGATLNKDYPRSMAFVLKEKK
jgi:hypothetical protein